VSSNKLLYLFCMTFKLQWKGNFLYSIWHWSKNWWKCFFIVPSAPIPHDSLHSSPFYLKRPRTAATEKPPETRGHPGCNDKSKNYPSAHKRRIKPPQALPRGSEEHPWCTRKLTTLDNEIYLRTYLNLEKHRRIKLRELTDLELQSKDSNSKTCYQYTRWIHSTVKINCPVDLGAFMFRIF
jgi:hypothetical protein